MPFASIFLAISRLLFSMPSAIPSRLAVSTEFLMSRYAILLVSYSLISCGVNLAISALMYLSSTCFIRDSFKLILLQRLCQWVQWKLAFELPSAVQSSAKIRWKFVTSKFLGNFLHWGIEKNKSIGTPCRICAFSLNTLMLWRVACLKLEWGLLQ